MGGVVMVMVMMGGGWWALGAETRMGGGFRGMWRPMSAPMIQQWTGR